MSMPLLATKLHVPQPRPNAVPRARLIERLNGALHRKLTLVSAPAGFGKTTIISEWAAGCESAIAWVSLDSRDNDPGHFLMYLVAALRTIVPHIGESILSVLQVPQPPPPESILTVLLNDISTTPDRLVLILDDYHVIDAQPINKALAFLIEHLPPQLHLVIATRENPVLPLARYRAGGQLIELRAIDLRFTLAEASEFLNQVMGLTLSEEDIKALESRTEGWIAGLQMAALSMQGRDDTTRFIQDFSGSHHFVLDYLVEEVLQRQPASVQVFMLRTAVLDRLCGPLCDAVLQTSAGSGQTTLEYLERSNLFIVALDHERRWYRYHHLFADLLRQRLGQAAASTPEMINGLHHRASLWYEANGLDVEAFHHAIIAQDIDRAARLSEGAGIPLHFRGTVTSVIDWLASLPTAVLDARPSLWVRYAGLMLVVGQTTGVEEKLQAGEAALKDVAEDDATRNLIGQIAAARATLALTQYRIEDMAFQSRRALEYLSRDNLPFRATANWTLGYAYAMQGNPTTAGDTFMEAISISQAAGDTFTMLLATIGLGQVQEIQNQLHQAAETYQRVLQIAGDQPLQIIYEAYLGLARLHYEWNNLDLAQQYGQQSLHLARQYDRVIDRYIVCEVFLARIMLAQGDSQGAAALLGQTDRSAQKNGFVHRMPEIAEAQVLVHLQQGHLAEAEHIVHQYDLKISRVRVALAQGKTATALALLEIARQHAGTTILQPQDEHLRVMALQAIALYRHGEKASAVDVIREVLTRTEPESFTRLFVDEGLSMRAVLYEALINGIAIDQIRRLLPAFGSDEPEQEAARATIPPTDDPDSLSEREVEVLQLMAEGLTNQDIATKLYLSLHTVKVHVRHINAKLGASNRTQAVARGRALRILPS